MHKIINKKNIFPIIKSAVDRLVDTVKPTYGAAANKIIIKKELYSMAVDDGVQIARDFRVDSPEEQAVVDIVKQAAITTNDRVGDGTTGALIMLQAIIAEAAKKQNIDGKKIEEELKKALEEVKEQIKKESKEIKTKVELEKVARISFNNEKISKMIADTYWKLGKDGVITIEKSPTATTEVEITSGYKIPHGYISPYMVTNTERMETIIEKPYLLITDYRITETTDILPLMEKMVQNNKRELVIIANNVESTALSTLVVNKLNNQFLAVAVVAPKDKVELEDLAIMTGGRFFSEQKGDKLEDADIPDLGRAERAIIRKDETIIVSPKNKKGIKEAVEKLKVLEKEEKNEKQKEQIKKRIAKYNNTLAVIRVGAITENEQKALKYKVEDAVNAVKAAYIGGISIGGGQALSRVRTSSRILNEALQYPKRQILDNLGIEEPVITNYRYAYNVVTRELGDYIEVGVIDPTDVIIAGVESAVSIACVLLTSGGMIVEYTENK